MRAQFLLPIVVVLGATLSARTADATAGMAEWTIQTPGGHIIAHSRENPSPGRQTEWQPHAPNPIHPPEVARIMKLLPQIPRHASVDELIALLGLPKEWNGGSVSATECTMIWNFPGGYRFVLSFDPVPKNGKLTLEFREASFSAPNKPGFPPDEGHTVFPYRTWKGMRYK